jgi:hypothetical protein
MTARFATRDIGYGVEEGEVKLPPLSEPDWTGKREYRTTTGEIVYLFDDELLPDEEEDSHFYCERAECGKELTFDDIQAGDGLCASCEEATRG